MPTVTIEQAQKNYCKVSFGFWKANIDFFPHCCDQIINGFWVDIYILVSVTSCKFHCTCVVQLSLQIINRYLVFRDANVKRLKNLDDLN